MNTDVSCSFSVPQKFAAPSSCSSTCHHSDPLLLGTAGLGCFHLPQSSFYFLHLPVPATIREQEWCACSRSSKRPFHPCPVALLPVFCILQEDGDAFCSTPSKDGSYIFSSFKKWIASGWGGAPGARKDVIQQDLLSDKDSAQNRYLMTVYLHIMWPHMTSLKRYLPVINKLYPEFWHRKARMFYSYLNVSQQGATRTKTGAHSIWQPLNVLREQKGTELQQVRKTFFFVGPPAYLHMCRPLRREDI